jgi:hypothetical protein
MTNEIIADVALPYCEGGAFVGAHEHSRERRPFQYIAAKYPQPKLQHQHCLGYLWFVLLFDELRDQISIVQGRFSTPSSASAPHL